MHGINEIKIFHRLNIKENLIKLQVALLIFNTDAHRTERPCSFSITLRAEA